MLANMGKLSMKIVSGCTISRTCSFFDVNLAKALSASCLPICAQSISC